MRSPAVVSTPEYYEDEDCGIMLGTTNLLPSREFRLLQLSLPSRLHDYNLVRLFSTDYDGVSFSTFYSKLKNQGPNIILIKDDYGHVFGGFCAENWHPGTSYYGTGECFTFSILPKFAVYKWTGANECCMLSNYNFIGMGGGSNARFAFYLDSEFNWGTSAVTNTFLNRRLSNNEEFHCVLVEVWGFQRATI